MTDPTLHAFCRQLADWIDSLLLQGRYPFRKAELSPSLLTAAGEEHPSLVLWINRDSFMAGGLLFVPPDLGAATLAHACRCAEALGLRHFTVWDRQEISFWTIRPTGPHCRRRQPFVQGENLTPEHFQSALTQILNDWKQNAVQGALPPAQLSHFYFASLCWQVMEDILPGLTESLHQALALQPASVSASIRQPTQAARCKGFLTLLRLVTLETFALLPPTAPPEGLERAGRFAIQTLEPALARVLSAPPDELPLDPASAIRFHHLLRRFGQLQLGSDHARLARTLELLLTAARPWLSGQPLPPLPEPLPACTLLLHPDRPTTATGEVLEVVSQPELAAFNLMRTYVGLPVPRHQAETPFDLREVPAPLLLAGSLQQASPPARSELPALTAWLRTSWPTRRFQIPPELPRWGWELLHLLGIAAPGAHFLLRIPALRPGTATFAWCCQLLAKETDTIALQATDSEWRLTLNKGGPVAEPLHIDGPGGKRTLPAELFHCHPSASIALALLLSDPLYTCLCDGRLRLGEAGTLPDDHAIRLYGRSSLAGTLWTCLGGTPAIPLLQRPSAGLPIPAPDILTNLATASPPELPAPATMELDRLLEQWLPPLGPLPSPSAGNGVLSSPQRTSGQIDAARVRALAAEVFRDGIPAFPEHYLYAHYRPELRGYTFVPPLRLTGEFFDQLTLEDARGETITVAGRASAEALLLTAAVGRETVALPVEEQLAGELVQRYCSDLQARYQELRRLAFRQELHAASAEKLVAAVWKSQPLPPPALFSR